MKSERTGAMRRHAVACVTTMLLLAALAGCEGGTPWDGNVVGNWAVTTTLVEAQEAPNKDYEPGDQRRGMWTYSSRISPTSIPVFPAIPA